MTDDCLFAAAGEEYELVVDDRGEPVNGGVELISVERTSPALHTRFGPRDVRIYADCRTVRTGQLVLKVWFLECGESDCPKRTGERCLNPRPKKGVAGVLRNDAFVALGRRMRPKERVPSSTFRGRTFVARLLLVVKDEEGDAREQGSWYTKAGPFLATANFPGEEPPLPLEPHRDLKGPSPVPSPVAVPFPFPSPSSSSSSRSRSTASEDKCSSVQADALVRLKIDHEHEAGE